MENNFADKKILLCEDEEFLATSYSFALNKIGFTVVLAMNGVEAIEKTASEKPDIILLDLIMPLKNGFEVLSEIKNNPESAQIPVIIMSNLTQDLDITKTKEMGAVDYIVKSNVTLKEIIEIIKKNLE